MRNSFVPMLVGSTGEQAECAWRQSCKSLLHTEIANWDAALIHSLLTVGVSPISNGPWKGCKETPCVCRPHVIAVRL